ncbi:hypothetical protein [Leucobacter japonicus]|uniref:hypothetical protein n=1 Tax=Leucobacter japonicus TaxID=1461259 RepID=UPI0012E1CA58|nr:hypothetical protein [Leucobacter japonicus]
MFNNQPSQRTTIWIAVALILGVGTLATLGVSQTSGLPIIQVVMIGVFMAIAFATVTIAAFGFIVADTIPPLRPLAERSVLGKRIASYKNFGVSSAALLGTVYITWLITRSYEAGFHTGNRNFNSLAASFEILPFLLVFAAWVQLFLLTCDLFRIGYRRRMNAIDYATRAIAARTGTDAIFLREIGRASMSSMFWIAITLIFALPLVASGLSVLVLASLPK